jgi:hypothetical protein
MAMTIAEDKRAITGGAGMRVAAALDPIGGLLGVQEFPATAAGYAGLLGWLGGFGTVALVGIEGTGSYGAGLARHMAAAGVRVTVCFTRFWCVSPEQALGVTGSLSHAWVGRSATGTQNWQARPCGRRLHV